MAAIKTVLIGLLAASSVVGGANGNMQGGKHPGLEIISDKFDTCPQYPGLENTIANLTLWTPPDEDVLYISGVLILRVQLEDSKDYKYLMKLKKCLKEDWSRCERYLDFEVKDMCRELPREENSWSGMVKKLEGFDPNCPIRPGTYNFEDAPIDTSDLSKVEAIEGYWQIELTTTYKGKAIFCVVGNAIIKRKPLKGRKGM